MARRTLTSDLLGTVTGLSKENEVEVPKTSTSDDKMRGELTGETGKRKPGRPKAGADEIEVNVTFRLPDSLVQEVKMLAVVERTTQKEIVIAALREYLAGKSDNK
jgi:hypothetical protein